MTHTATATPDMSLMSDKARCAYANVLAETPGQLGFEAFQVVG
jgi:hypothetical protein